MKFFDNAYIESIRAAIKNDIEVCKYTIEGKQKSANITSKTIDGEEIIVIADTGTADISNQTIVETSLYKANGDLVAKKQVSLSTSGSQGVYFKFALMIKEV